MRINRVKSELKDCSFSPVVSPKSAKYKRGQERPPSRYFDTQKSAPSDPTGDRLIQETNDRFLSSLRAPSSALPVPSKSHSLNPRLYKPPEPALEKPTMSEPLRTAFSSLVSASYQCKRPGNFNRQRRPFPSAVAADDATRRLQNWWRHAAPRIRMRRVLRRFVQIQAKWRGALLRKRVAFEKRAHLAAAAIQVFFLRWLLKRNLSAIFIQRWWKSVMLEKITIDTALVYFSMRVKEEQKQLRTLSVKRTPRVRKLIDLEIVKEKKKWKGVVDFERQSPRGDIHAAPGKRVHLGDRPKIRMSQIGKNATSTYSFLAFVNSLNFQVRCI